MTMSPSRASLTEHREHDQFRAITINAGRKSSWSPRVDIPLAGKRVSKAGHYDGTDHRVGGLPSKAVTLSPHIRRAFQHGPAQISAVGEAP